MILLFPKNRLKQQLRQPLASQRILILQLTTLLRLLLTEILMRWLSLLQVFKSKTRLSRSPLLLLEPMVALQLMQQNPFLPLWPNKLQRLSVMAAMVVLSLLMKQLCLRLFLTLWIVLMLMSLPLQQQLQLRLPQPTKPQIRLTKKLSLTGAQLLMG